MEVPIDFTSVGQGVINTGWDIMNEFAHERGGHIEYTKKLFSEDQNYKYDFKRDYWDHEREAVKAQMNHPSWNHISPKNNKRILEYYKPVIQQ